MYRIKGKRVVVIGGGEVAYRKVKDLIGAGAIVTVIAPHIGEDLSALTNDHSVTIVQRLYQKGDCKGAALVFSATNNTEINQQVFYEASELNIPINAVDDPDNSTFYVPSFYSWQTAGSRLHRWCISCNGCKGTKDYRRSNPSGY